ncbi:MAG TPA: EamA family transporter, partial [Actinomycetota bacterium]|nr:EamA family transporter [Actinomycetota bacterium]
MSPAASASQRAATWKVWSALWLVYIVWGSTYLAIRVAVRTMPPLLKAGSRFVIAGVILYLISRARSGRVTI